MGLAAIAPAQQVAIGEYAVPTPGGVALAVALGPDHALWFADLNSNANFPRVYGVEQFAQGK
jgi:streptogramin lyase